MINLLETTEERIMDLALELLEEFKGRQPTWEHVLLIGDCGGAVVSESENA